MHPPIASTPESSPVPSSRRRVVFVIAGILLALLFLVRLNIKGRFGGLFLLEGKGWRLLELKDDLYLGDGTRMIAGIDFGPIRRKVYEKHYPEKLLPSLELEWDEASGSGYVIGRQSGGRQLVTHFGRFLSDDGEETKGLFVGGGLPETVRDDNVVKLSETGMAYFDGRRWLHIWCSSNEAILSTSDASKLSYPTEWRFIGSRVMHDGPRHVVLSSTHVAQLDGMPIRIERFAYFHAEESYFRLGIRIRNEGDRAVPVVYLYGDEPWLGDYGSSKGNVGWTSRGLVYTAASIDPVSHSYAGMFDCGNPLVSPRRDFTRAANFIEWLGSNKPSLVYFGNGAGFNEIEAAAGTPLSSDERFIGLQWGPRTLAPGEETAIFLAIGMADVDPRTALPVKPPVPIRSELD